MPSEQDIAMPGSAELWKLPKTAFLDPPYNTGNDFVYEDDFLDTLARYKEMTSQATKSNPETMGRFHTNWLNMAYPRLRLAANLLRDDGVIFMSIDDGEQANLRKICDEIFGEIFVANIMWQKRYSPANDHKTICPMHDFVMVYRKSDLWERNLLARTEKNDAQYRYEDERGIFRASDYTCNKTASECPNLYYPVTQPNTGDEIWPSKDVVWRYSKERHEENVKQGLVFWGKQGTSLTPSFKRYRDDLRDGGGTVPGTWWTFEFAGHNDEAVKETGNLIGNRIFSTPKPVRLIQRMLQLSTAPDSDNVVLDFFSGSSASAHAVMQQNAEDGGNRQFIMVQLPELVPEKSEAYEAGFKNICEIGKERICHAGAQLLETFGQGILGQTPRPLDIGFKVFKLDSSNLKTWGSSHITAEKQKTLLGRLNDMIERVKPDRTDMDMVYEVMLKLGVPLDFPVTKLSVNGTTAYTVGEDCLLLVCLEPGLGCNSLPITHLPR
jgi:adenine-specific DNA-methyltransferase